MPPTSSAYIAGSVYYLSMVLSPFLGFVIVSLIFVVIFLVSIMNAIKFLSFDIVLLLY